MIPPPPHPPPHTKSPTASLTTCLSPHCLWLETHPSLSVCGTLSVLILCSPTPLGYLGVAVCAHSIWGLLCVGYFLLNSSSLPECTVVAILPSLPPPSLLPSLLPSRPPPPVFFPPPLTVCNAMSGYILLQATHVTWFQNYCWVTIHL